MQEKVQSAPPPEIKIFEGKPPPTSWVDENIVRYYQVQSEIEFLTDVVTYVQELQAQQLSQVRPKPLMLKEAFIPFPEAGSAEDMSNVSIYNSAQSYLKIHIEFSQKLINILKQGNPELAKELDKSLADLRDIVQSFPRLSKQQMEILNALMPQLTNYAQRVPINFQRAFWKGQLNMLQNLMMENGANIKDFQNETKELQARSQMLLQIQQLLENIHNTLKAQPPSKEQLMELLENLQTLANTNIRLNPDQQQALVTVFQQLGQFKTTKGQGLTQLLADSLIHTKLSSFMQAKPNASPAEVLAYLTQFLKQSNLQSSNLPFMKSLGDSIEDVLDQKGFPASSGFTGDKFATIEENNIKPNEEMVPKILAQYAPNENSVHAFKNASDDLTFLASDEVAKNSEKIEGYATTLSHLKKTQNNFGKAAAWAVGQSMATGQPPEGSNLGAEATGPKAIGGNGSLPSQFEHAILDHYMPGQQAYLQSLAMWLFIANNGAEFGNQLLTDMLDFGEAADNYNFSNWLHSANGDFSGSVTQATQRLSNERTQCSNDMNNTIQAQEDIQKQLDQINNDLQNPDLTASQRASYQEMASKLQSIQENLIVAYYQLTNLKSILDSITVEPPTGSGHTADKYFSIDYTVENWQSKLNTAETQVVNGDPKSQPSGGLVSIQASAQSFQQTYSDQGQNQQMILQMHMTEIQQEWTVVSTAMQLLNQMYMTCSQAIYK